MTTAKDLAVRMVAAALLMMVHRAPGDDVVYLVRDINQLDAGSNPAQFANLGGIAYFSANNGVHGGELWKSDGTDSGTVLVRDIYPGTGGSGIAAMLNANGTLFFSANDGVNGAELWKSDGTASGTVLVKDIYSGLTGSSIASLTSVNGTVFLSANDGTNGAELWKTDGTASGTVLVKDIYPGATGSSLASLTNVNGTLFFIANDGTNGAELWKSDGTASGTVLLKDIYPGATGSSLAYLTSMNGTLYFRANDGTNGAELWTSDGTASGTAMVRNIRAGANSSSPAYLTNVNGTLFFSANDGTNGVELWKSDGTTTGTVLVKNIRSGTGNSNPINMANINGVLYFRANNGTNGAELWKSDGTSTGTVLVKDIYPGATGSALASMTNVNGTAFFTANNGANGAELWKSDGTSTGTAMARDIYPGTAGSALANLFNANGTLFCRATDGTLGNELWKSDGTASGTVLVKDINQNTTNANPAGLISVNGTVLFSATDGTSGTELWKSDGTTAGTVMVKNINPGAGSSTPSYLTNVNGTVFFSATDGTTGTELWKSDGTSAGTTMVRDIRPGANSSTPAYLTNVNGTLFFSANNGTNGIELWKSDGTTAGTVLVRDIYSGATGSSPASLTNVNGTLFFGANNGTNGIELWKSDGTSSGTLLVRDIYSGATGSSPANLTNVNGTLFFSANNGTNGFELWKSDGTASGTVLVKDICPGATSSSLTNFANISGTLYFSANDGTNGAELWKSDGTASGTTMVKDIAPGAGNSNPTAFVAYNGVVYFQANGGTNGAELWTTDGTSAGTTLVKDIFPGVGSSNPLRFTSYGGLLFFAATDGTTGTELWKTDGTGSGTVLVEDIQPGSGGSTPDFLTVANNRLFFRANDYTHGIELWAAYESPDPPVMAAEPEWTSGTQNTVYWSASATATTYTVECDDAEDFGSPVASADVSSPTLSHMFTGLSDGTTYWYRVRATNSLGLTGLWSNTTSSTQDAVLPTVAMSSAAPNPTNTSPILVTVTFSESVTGFVAGDISVTNGSVSGFGGSGTSYTFNMVPSGQGAVTANIGAGVAQDVAGNGSTAAAPLSRTYDSVRPSVSMSSSAGDPTDTTPIPVTVTFSESVTGFTASDIVTSNGSVANFSGSGASYSFDLLPSGQGEVTADIPADVCTDAAGNGNTAAAQFRRQFTAVELISFEARRFGDKVLLEWRTGYEVNNLGFHVYREERGGRRRLTLEMVAGTALLAGGERRLTAGAAYAWWDASPPSAGHVGYWLEDVDLGGKRTQHGPVSAVASDKPLPARSAATRLARVGRAEEDTLIRVLDVQARLRKSPAPVRTLPARSPERRGVADRPPAREKPPRDPREVQWDLAGRRGVKITVREEGWYRIGQRELAAAGLDAKADSRLLQLYVNGEELAMAVSGEWNARAQNGSIEFYGNGQDTPWTDGRVYWLVAGTRPGKRVVWIPGFAQPSAWARDFPATVAAKPRSVYFAGLRNGEAENFFGPVITSEGVDQLLRVTGLANEPASEATVEVGVQGVTAGPHRVSIRLNNVEIGTLTCSDQARPATTVRVTQASLLEGDNVVSLVARGGETDVSLVDFVRLTYPRAYTAEGDVLRCTVGGGQTAVLEGFRSPRVSVVDVTDPANPQRLVGVVWSRGGTYAVEVRAPAGGERTLLAFTDQAIKQPAAMAANQPSSWHGRQAGADLVIVAQRAFAASVAPLRQLRAAQGLSAAVVDVEDLYDEFNFGSKSPRAVREFLASAKTRWRRSPRYVLLVGDASVDPRNYLGFGDDDFVPTKLVDTALMETASDDWFADFNDDGLPEMAVGRLPVATADEAATVVAKILAYEQTAPGDWSKRVLLVSDNNDVFDFQGASAAAGALLPTGMPYDGVFLGWTDLALARSMLREKLNAGQLLVNYVGHGSADVWAGEGLLTGRDAESLANNPRLPFVVCMTCLNGFFHGPMMDCLAESLQKADGGAVAVWASSGLTHPSEQSVIDRQLFRELFGGGAPTLGEATMRAKAATSDPDIRRTWILFGDPTLRLK